jgi:hypothetical protein
MARTVAFTLTLILLTSSMAFTQTQLDRSRHFEKVRLLERAGDDKFKATKVMVRFDLDRMVLQSTQGEELKVFPYSSIKHAEYVFAEGPRYKGNVGTILLANVFAIPLFVVKVERHRLEVQSDADYALLDLDKSNYEKLLSAFERNSGKKVVAD